MRLQRIFQPRRLQQRPLALSVLVALTLLIVSCTGTDTSIDKTGNAATLETTVDTSGNNGNGTLGLKAPEFLLEGRAINLDQVNPVVSVNQQAVEMTRIEETQWSGTIDVPANSTFTLSIEWLETFGGTDLTLALFEQNMSVGAEASTVTLSNSDYNLEIDSDNDGFSNLVERNASSDPFNATDQPPFSPGSTDVSLLIPLVSNGSVPQIDGLGAVYDTNALRLVGEWAQATPNGTDGGTDLFVDSLMITGGGDEIEPFHAWAALHDGEFLYILVLVDDLSLNHGDSGLVADDDSIEIFIDGNNSNFTTYSDADDRHFRIALLGSDGAANNSLSPAARIVAGENSFPVPGANVEFAIGLGTGPLSVVGGGGERHDVYEVKLELASFGISLEQPFGIEVQINDDDNGAERDTKWGWSHPERRNSNIDLTVSNPSFMDTAQLQN